MDRPVHRVVNLIEDADQRGQKPVDSVEVLTQGWQLGARRDAGGGNAEVQIDVWVDTQEGVLQDDGPPLARDIECKLPRPRKSAALSIGVECVQSFHTWTVVEDAVRDGIPHLCRDLAVECGKVTQPRPIGFRVVDDGGQPTDDVVNCAESGSHGVVAVCDHQILARMARPGF